MLAKMPSDCFSTSSLFILQLVASILTIGIALSCIFLSNRIKTRYFLLTSAAVLRFWTLSKAFAYSD